MRDDVKEESSNPNIRTSNDTSDSKNKGKGAIISNLRFFSKKNKE